MTEHTDIEQNLAELRQDLLQHRVYTILDSESALVTFMESHVFAVWDFMSLLKALQQRLTCVSVPWVPPAQNSAARLINEIVLTEESDTDSDGQSVSHFEMYLAAMRDAGAETAPIETLIEALRAGDTSRNRLPFPPAPPGVREFVETTFELINQNDLCAITGAFTFGRERLLPDVFQQIVATLNPQHNHRFSSLKYYLQRHIEIDGDEHGHLSQRLLHDLCGSDHKKWQAAEDGAREALQARLNMWNAIADRIEAESPEIQLMGLS